MKNQETEDDRLLFRVNHGLRAIIPEKDVDILLDDNGNTLFRYIFEDNGIVISFLYNTSTDSLTIYDESTNINASGLYEYWQDRRK